MLVFGTHNHVSAWWLVHRRDAPYALMVFVMMAMGVALASVTWPTWSATSGSVQYTVAAVVPPARPDKPAIITSPANGQTFSTNPVTVEGTCGAGSIVKIFTNGIFVGSVICSSGGRFSVPIDLVIGRNDLTAIPFNTLDQQGPTSPTVTVTLNQPPGAPGFSTELLLQSPNYYRGTKPGEEIVWPVTIVGGQAPYAVSVDWGDGTSDLITRLEPGSFTVKHTYKRVGTGYLNSFPLIIRATDAAGHTAYLQVTTIVNDPAGSNTGSGSGAVRTTSTMGWLWPLWVVLLLMIISFWLGKRYEKHVMERQLAALA